jgi:hypothetical protein
VLHPFKSQEVFVVPIAALDGRIKGIEHTEPAFNGRVFDRIQGLLALG